MSHSHPLTAKAVRFYSCLLMLYPQSYREAFGAQMLQTFKDHCNDVLGDKGKLGIGFWVGVVSDESKNIALERTAMLKSQRVPTIFLLMFVLLLAGLTVVFSKLVYPVVIGLLLVLTMYIIVKKQPIKSKDARPFIRNIWAKQGLYYGVGFGILYTAASIIAIFLTRTSQFSPLAKSSAALLFLVSMPGILALAGFHTGKKSNDASQGMLAGILTAGVGSIIFTIIMTLTMLSYWKLMNSNPFQESSMISAWRDSGSFDDSQWFLWLNKLDGTFFLSLYMLICGGILGTLGGFVGASDPKRAES